MKILYVHHNPNKGGSSNSLRYLLQSLESFPDIEIVVSTPAGEAASRFQRSGFKTIISPRPFFFATGAGVRFQWLYLLASLLLVKKNKKYYETLFKKEKADIIHFNEVGLIYYLKVAKSMGFKTVLHCRIAASPKYPIVNNIVAKYIDKYADRVIAIDNSALYSLKNIDQTKATIIYNPFHLSKDIINFVPKKSDDSTFRVGFLSNFLVHKGILDFIKAAIILKDQSNIQFFVAGANVKPRSFYNSITGKILDVFGIYPDLEKKVNKLIKKHGLHNIKLLGDITDVDSFLKNINVMVTPLHMNEPSRSIFESGIYGIPSIISMKDKIEDVVEDGVTGYIVEEKCPEQIANNILKLANNQILCTELGEKAREKYLKMNDSRYTAFKMSELYNRILEEN